jgi:hypothetical protein
MTAITMYFNETDECCCPNRTHHAFTLTLWKQTVRVRIEKRKVVTESIYADTFLGTTYMHEDGRIYLLLLTMHQLV